MKFEQAENVPPQDPRKLVEQIDVTRAALLARNLKVRRDNGMSLSEARALLLQELESAALSESGPIPESTTATVLGGMVGAQELRNGLMRFLGAKEGSVEALPAALSLEDLDRLSVKDILALVTNALTEARAELQLLAQLYTYLELPPSVEAEAYIQDIQALERSYSLAELGQEYAGGMTEEEFLRRREEIMLLQKGACSGYYAQAMRILQEVRALRAREQQKYGDR